MDLFGRVGNLFDRQYVGSVIVNRSTDATTNPRPDGTTVSG